jgi:hypothetical protein
MQRLVGFASLVALWLCACPAVPAADVNHYVSANGGLRVLPPMYYQVGRTAPPPRTDFGHAQVSYNHGYAADPSCGAEAQCCEHEPNCGDALWDDYCCTKQRCRKHCCLAFLHHRKRCGGCMTDCGCDLSCGSACNTCDSGCSSGGCNTNHGCDSCHAYDTVGLGCDACCSGQRWGFQGCNACCKPCYRPHCKPIRCWANSWCGDLLDGNTTGHPVCAATAAPAAPCTNCQLGSPAGEAPMNAPMPVPMVPADKAAEPPMPGDAKEALPVPEKAARSFRFSPVSTRTFSRGDVIK